MKVGQVSKVIKASAQETARARAETGELAPVAQCLLNTSCAERLLGNQEQSEQEVGGLGMVVVARTTGYKRFVVCSYLIDYWCLGLKDTRGEQKMNDIKYKQLVEMLYGNFPKGYQEISLEQAQAIVYGAIEYAEELGLKPHKDWQQTRSHLGAWSGEPKLTFGKEGSPYYISGPYDNTAQILQTLREKVGEGNFHYMVGIG